MELFFIIYFVGSFGFWSGVMIDSYLNDQKTFKELEIKYNMMEELLND